MNAKSLEEELELKASTASGRDGHTLDAFPVDELRQMVEERRAGPRQ